MRILKRVLMFYSFLYEKIFRCFFFVLLLFPQMALAVNDDTPVSQGLSYVIDAMYGKTGVAIATIAIIAVGLLCLGHYLEWKTFFLTVAGVGIIFGAGTVVTGIQTLTHV